MRDYRVILFAIVLASCKATQPTTSSTVEETYSEDLSRQRPELTLDEPAQATNNPVASVEAFNTDLIAGLDSAIIIMSEQNRSRKYIEGYAVQIYTGNSREAADRAINEAKRIDPSLNPERSYFQPTYKVKAGTYVQRLKAHKVLVDLKEFFPKAILVRERIPIENE